MEIVVSHSINRALKEAAILWALASSEYPIENGATIQDEVEALVIESVSIFSINARRAMEGISHNRKFTLAQPRFAWEPTGKGEKVDDFRKALNRIIHARKVEVGFERLPEEISSIEGGAVVVPYIRTRTDRQELAFTDLFALAHCFLTTVHPALLDCLGDSRTPATQQSERRA